MLILFKHVAQKKGIAKDFVWFSPICRIVAEKRHVELKPVNSEVVKKIKVKDKEWMPREADAHHYCTRKSQNRVLFIWKFQRLLQKALKRNPLELMSPRKRCLP